mmetsp:Transcript_34163/g.50198  ORF Transcript_34163/g.50198 Transcript_34163/m.50198 type:complete len:147 (-) Transcript_34163:312-752(-)
MCYNPSHSLLQYFSSWQICLRPFQQPNATANDLKYLYNFSSQWSTSSVLLPVKFSSTAINSVYCSSPSSLVPDTYFQHTVIKMGEMHVVRAIMSHIILLCRGPSSGQYFSRRNPLMKPTGNFARNNGALLIAEYVPSLPSFATFIV